MDYINQFVALIDGVKLITLFALIFIDFILGVVVALKEGTFQLSKIGNFINTSVLGLVGGYFIVGAAATFEPQFASVVTATWLLLDATILGFITAKLSKLGVPMPPALGGKTNP